MQNSYQISSLATLALLTTALALPFNAHARKSDQAPRTQYLPKCAQDIDTQIIGGLLGAIAGGFIGTEIAAPHNDDEGALVGAILGATAGASLANDKCDNTVHPVHYRRQRDFYAPVHPRRSTNRYLRRQLTDINAQIRDLHVARRQFRHPHSRYRTSRRHQHFNRINRRLDILYAKRERLTRRLYSRTHHRHHHNDRHRSVQYLRY